ncbi:HNH endonuclease [Haloterrigena sp. SYSU A558-1]|uniref:HNH endonuclease n=1 Tax=Haloterrigena gelatinilytica TaxID=2741724 RepID=A0ABX2LHY9_9EURY|nr:HNH endonuclease [Haloterrigena gelatinilytica]
MGYAIPAQTRRDVYRRDRYRCAFCAKTQQQHQRETTGDRRLHLHHIWPRNNGGSNSRRNLITLCRSCHAQIEATAQAIIRKYPEDEARYRVRWVTIKRVRNDHPNSTPWTMAERAHFRRYVGDDPLIV